MLAARRRPLTTLLAALSLSCAACGPATYNVRASRAFSNEDASAAVVNDRTQDLSRAVSLAGELLSATPYSPGDPWVSALTLDDARGDELRERFASAPPYSGEYEVPLAKLYLARIDEALALARAPRAGGAAKHPSLLDAAAGLAPGAAGLPLQWRAVVEARKQLTATQQRVDWLAWNAAQAKASPADAAELVADRALAAVAEAALQKAQEGLRGSIEAVRAASPKDPAEARDVLQAVSFALRTHIEALAVAPYCVKQARRLASGDPSQATVVTKAAATSALLEEERAALATLAEALTVPARTTLEEAAGFAMHESLIEQAARVNIDATHVHVKGDAELLFFHQLASAGSSGGGEDYTGRTRRLTYSIDPVFMVGGRVIAAYDFLHVKNAARLNAGFTTDRLFGSGGTIENQNSLGQLIGLHGLVSDFFDMGLDLLGVRTSVKIARFTSGEVAEVAVDPVTGKDTRVVEKAPFQLDYHQIDVGYDFAGLSPDLAEDLSVEELIGGFRYMDYGLPRIFYELEEQTPGKGAPYVLSRQSPAQAVDSLFYMGGLSARFGQGDWPRLSFFGDVGLYGGAGPVKYYFTDAPEVRGGERDAKDATMIAFNGSASLGGRLRLTPRLSRPRLVMELSYHAEILGQGVVTELHETKKKDETTYTVGKKLDLGGFDLFHGPRLIVVVVF